MTPGEFYDSYKNIQFWVEGKYFTNIAAKKYVINYGKGADLVNEINTKLGGFRTAAKDQMRGDPGPFARNHIIQIDTGAFTRTVYGKGSPSDMIHVLKVGILTGQLEADQQKVAGFAAKYFGTDCTGFVCSYFRELLVMPAEQSPLNTGCNYFYEEAKKTGAIIWNARDIKQDDILVWMDETGKESRTPGHIALIDSVELLEPLSFEMDVNNKEMSCSVRLNCCESNGASGEDPRRTIRFLTGVAGNIDHHNRYWTIQNPFTGGTGKVLVMRPFERLRTYQTRQMITKFKI